MDVTKFVPNHTYLCCRNSDPLTTLKRFDRGKYTEAIKFLIANKLIPKRNYFIIDKSFVETDSVSGKVALQRQAKRL